MKKVVMLFILMLIFPLLTAVEFEMKTEFEKGETLFAKVSGNFIEPVMPENVFFYRGNARMPFLYDIVKIQDEFYIYALLPEVQNNYSLVIKDVEYMKGSKVIDDEIKKDFFVSNNSADFYVNPGFIVTKEDFFIKVQNLKDEKITIKTDDSRDIILKSGEIKKINFKIENVTDTIFKKTKLSSSSTSYEIPTYILGVDINETQENKTEFRFSPVALNVSMTTNSNKTKIIYLYNTGQTELENVSLLVSNALIKYVFSSTDEIEKLKEGSNIKIELNILSPEQKDFIEGHIRAKTENGDTAYLPIDLNFLKDYEPLPETQEEDYGEFEAPVFKTCSQMQGKICSENEKCDGPSAEAGDGMCCLGICKEKKKSPVGKIIGWTLAIILIILIYWFLIKKYKGAKRDVNLLEVGEGKKKVK